MIGHCLGEQGERGMQRSTLIRALLGGSAMLAAAPAIAQNPPAASDQAQQLDEAQAKIEQLQAQVDALQKSIAQIQAQMAKATPSWKGAPQLEEKSAGWSFKPRGRLQYDVG